MSTTTKNPTATDLRADLRRTYKVVVDNWALSAADVASVTGQDLKEVNSLLNRLARARLVDSLHVNGEKSLTWQSYHDIANDSTWRAAARDFDKAFPKGEAVTAAPTRANGTGPAYTDAQLKKGHEARIAGKSWKGVAEVAKVKSPVYFSKRVREAFPKTEKQAAAARKQREKGAK